MTPFEKTSVGTEYKGGGIFGNKPGKRLSGGKRRRSIKKKSKMTKRKHTKSRRVKR